MRYQHRLSCGRRVDAREAGIFHVHPEQVRWRRTQYATQHRAYHAGMAYHQHAPACLRRQQIPPGIVDASDEGGNRFGAGRHLVQRIIAKAGVAFGIGAGEILGRATFPGAEADFLEIRLDLQRQIMTCRQGARKIGAARQRRTHDDLPGRDRAPRLPHLLPAAFAQGIIGLAANAESLHNRFKKDDMTARFYDTQPPSVTSATKLTASTTVRHTSASAARTCRLDAAKSSSLPSWSSCRAPIPLATSTRRGAFGQSWRHNGASSRQRCSASAKLPIKP